MEVEIDQNGAVLLGKNVACDAHCPKPIRVVTHSHFDHIGGLDESIAHCEKVLMTPATRDLLEILKSKKSVDSPKIHCLRYGETFEYENEKLTFFSANHIIGSAQVLLESDIRIVYTGDFKLYRGGSLTAPTIPSDILVMDATYGNPHRRRTFKNEITARFIDLVKKSLEAGIVYIFGYYGKLQEILEIIHTADIETPVIVPEKVFKMMQVCERHGMKFGNYFSSKSEEAKGLDHFIGLYHMGSKQWIGKGATKITLSGWEFDMPVRQERAKEFTVAFSDHADFDELLQYVGLSKPKRVITDNKRGGDAVTLAKEITKRFGIPAEPLPSSDSMSSVVKGFSA